MPIPVVIIADKNFDQLGKLGKNFTLMKIPVDIKPFHQVEIDDWWKN